MRISKRSARSRTWPNRTSSRARSTPPSTPASVPPAWTRCSTSSARAPKLRCARASTSSSCPTAWSAPTAMPIPSLLACAAVHHHLIRTGLRTSVGLVVESGEPREVHHFACLAGYGAEAINPYLAFETIIAMKDRLPGSLDDYEIVKRYIKSIGKGLLKVMSKMGISTYQSYCGAQIFDAVGLKADFVAKYLRRHAYPRRGRRPRRDRRRSRAPSCRRVRRCAGLQDRARCRRRICLSQPRRGPCLDRGVGLGCCSTPRAAIRWSATAPSQRSSTSSRSVC